MKKKLMSLACAGLVLLGGGTWSYGTNEEIHPNQKYVWSNYSHGEKWHASSATIGGKTNDSYATKPGIQSKASIVGSQNHLGKANWRYQEPEAR